MPYSLKRRFTCEHCKRPTPLDEHENCEFCGAELCLECCRYTYLRLAICPYCEENEERGYGAQNINP